MKNYEFLEHTADEKFRAYGKTLEEAFINAALATAKIMTDDKVKPTIEKKIEIKVNTKEKLLYQFLEELLFYVDTEGFILSEVKDLEIKDNFTLTATFLGDSAEDYEIKAHIKAITYNDMFIKEEENLVTIQVVHDL
ncbi:archease [archaeon]|jgi:SHS2 domain-containing protein|nr:archease [archaeon]MBT3730656.1 archease [archaeon]MBT4669558.1 archease [archaeon]MBT5030315.1 archease [archaeon]MBT5288392.1 archease [archaeon]